MINQFLLFFLIICTFEFINHFKIFNILKSILIIYKKIIKILYFKKVSDTRKQMVILNYSKQLIIYSVKIFFILSFIFVFILIIIFFSNSFVNLMISPLGIIEITIIFYIYNKFRNKLYG